MWAFNITSSQWSGPLAVAYGTGVAPDLRVEGAAISALPGYPSLLMLYGGRVQGEGGGHAVAGG